MPVKPVTEMSAEWMRRFTLALTDELYRELDRYVDHQVRRHQSFENREDKNEARGLVHDVICDTMNGIRWWDPDGPIPLAMHIRRGVQSRLSHIVTRAKARRFREINDLDEHGDNAAELEISLKADDVRTRTTTVLGNAEIAARLRREIDMSGKVDAEVMDLVDALLEGRGTPRDLEARFGWTAPYRLNVMRRLQTKAQGVPESLRRLVKELAFEASKPAAAVVAPSEEAEESDPEGEEENVLDRESWDGAEISRTGDDEEDFA